jgi:hypothetical protein
VLTDGMHIGHDLRRHPHRKSFSPRTPKCTRDHPPATRRGPSDALRDQRSPSRDRMNRITTMRPMR